MSIMDDDLFTYEIEISGLADIPCDLNKEDDSEQQMSHETDDDMEYDPSNVEFTGWLASKFYNHKILDDYTKNALWIYWARGDDEVELTDEESSDSDDDDNEVAEIFRIDTNVFDFETPMDDGYCNEGNLPGAYIVGNALRYQDFEWYEALKDGKLKEEALKNKAIVEGIIDEDDDQLERRQRLPTFKEFHLDSKGDHTLLTFYMEDDVDISAFTMEQYIALILDDIKPGILNLKIGDNVEFEINANFMRELRRKLFTCTDDEDAYEHVRTVLKIVDLFHFPGVTHDAIILRKLEEIRNFKQERDETLYHAWKRYNDLLYQCPLHDLNCQQKVHIFYTILDISTRKILDSNGFIPLMTPTQALESIQVMADHSHDWYNETTNRKRINDIMENIDTIHESFKREHLTKEYPFKKEDEAIKHSRYIESLEETIIKFCKDTIKKQTADDERMRKILENTKSNIRALKTTIKNLQDKAYQLTHKVLTNT
ncbi:hypothetical protein Tco_0792590 [Tanacetum coccineum]